VTDHVELRRGAYHDSVSLLQVSRRVSAAPGVDAAQVAMATDLNVDLIRSMGFDVPESAVPNDLLIAVRARDDAGVEAARQAVDSALADLASRSGAAVAPGATPATHTLRSAVRAAGANLALVSVPGEYAVVEALDALGAGASVMVFSDNVSVEDEVRLKDTAAAADLIVMGPDCGTALVGGVALGFANAVRPGSVGIVAASGTGAQQVMCLLDAAHVGVSHCLGVGGRDLSSEVRGRSTRQALAALEEDEATSSVILVSKPPDPDVLTEVEQVAARMSTPVHWATLGPGRPDLTASVTRALVADGHSPPTWPSWPVDPDDARRDEELPSRGGSLRGLFCGGTLADEAMLIAQDALGGIRSNIPLSDELGLGPDLRSAGHVVLDFGDDALTRGRAHPMIDPTLRLERVRAEGSDPTCRVLLLDLVLGHGAHPDPAEGLATAVHDARATAHRDGRALSVVVSVTGVEADPQGLASSAQSVRDAGAAVFLSNAEATRHAVSLVLADRSR
jgi:FdrA protein